MLATRYHRARAGKTIADVFKHPRNRNPHP
jgi:hypothetical protein